MTLQPSAAQSDAQVQDPFTPRLHMQKISEDIFFFRKRNTISFWSIAIYFMYLNFQGGKRYSRDS